MALLAIVLTIVAIATPVVAFVALRRANAAREHLAAMRAKILSLEAAVRDLAPRDREPRDPARQDRDTRETEIEPPAAAAEPEATEPPAIEDIVGDTLAPEPAAGADIPEPVARESFERKLASRWLVWLGGITLALGGGFLVKVAIESGLLGPGVRVVLGLVAATAMIVAGEWLRRQPLHATIAAVSADYVPGALTAAGIFTAYGSLFAAYGLYDLISPLAGFVLLAMVSVLALLLSLAHGSFIAALGVVGAYLVPIIVTIGEPRAWGLFPYLLFVTAAALAVVRYRDWWGLAWLNLAGAALWPVLWFVTTWGPGDELPLSLYFLVLVTMFLAIRYKLEGSGQTPPGEEASRALIRIGLLPLPEQVAAMAAVAVAVLSLWLVLLTQHGTVAMWTVGVVAALYLAAARREPVFDILTLVAAALVLAALATWDMPPDVVVPGPVIAADGQTVGIEVGPMIPAVLAPFAGAGVALAALFGLAGFAALWGSRRPLLWAGLSAMTSVAILIILYWRIADFDLHIGWAMVALGLAAVILGAAERVGRYRAEPGMNGALGAYAIGVIAATTLAATMTLEEAWLTVALALQVPAIAWVHERLGLVGLRKVTLLVAAAVLIRLALNVDIFSYHLGSLMPGFNWLLYGYGIPAAAFFIAARIYRKTADDVLVHVLEAGTLLFLVLLASLEIRSFFSPGGNLVLAKYELLEQSLQTLTWLAFGYGLLVLQRRGRRPVFVWGRRILGTLAAGHVVIAQCLVDNPLFTGVSVGAYPIINVLLLAYAAPAVAGVLFFREARAQNEQWTQRVSGIFALILAFVWLSLEVRHAFHGANLARGATSDGEWYAYSIAWLAYGGGLLALGIWRRYHVLRYASLAVLLLTIAKVFLIDMSAIGGIFRALSFLGLGAALIAVGFFYQRYVFPPKDDKDDGEEALGQPGDDTVGAVGPEFGA